MILILSMEGEWSTDHVTGWLNHFNYPFIRLNSYDLFNKDFFMDFQKRVLYVGEQVIELKKINVVWFRKFGFFRFSNHFKKVREILDSESANSIANEFWAITQAIVDLLQDKKWLTNYNNCFLNKINILSLAESVGLEIPKTFLLNRYSRIRDIMNTESLISKTIDNGINIDTRKGRYTTFTSKVEVEDVDKLPEKFFPSLVQSEIKKKYEIRCFFLIDKFYSMAIFSQKEDQTKVDFRRYHSTNPNRNVPYQLPASIENKLQKLMVLTHLNCASIDLIKGIDNKYYFLEINPTGQFGMVDFPCNYGLHKKVAETLIEMDKN